MYFLNASFYGNTVTDWVLSLSIVIGVLIVAKILYFIFGKVIKKLTKKTKTKLDDIMVELLEKPIVQLVVIGGVWFAFNRLTFSDNISEWITNIYWFIVALTITWFIVRFIDALIQEYLVPFVEKSENDFGDILPIVRKISKIGIWSIGIIVALNNAGYDVTTLIAGLGIFGMGVALAAKDTVANIFGGVTIFMDKPFKMNDMIKVNGFSGTIKEIGIRSTKLKTFDNRTVTIPNSKFTDGMVENISSEPHRKVTLKLGLVYDTSAGGINAGMSALRQIVEEFDTLEDNSVISFNEFGDSALGILFIYYIKKGSDIMVTQTDVNMEIKERFEELGLDMAFPTQTIYTKSA